MPVFVLTMGSALHLPILSDQTRPTVKEAVMQLIEWEVNEDGKDTIAVGRYPHFPFILSRARNPSIQH